MHEEKEGAGGVAIIGCHASRDLSTGREKGLGAGGGTRTVALPALPSVPLLLLSAAETAAQVATRPLRP